MYFIVTVIIGFVLLEANLAAAGRLSSGIACRQATDSLPAGYTRRLQNRERPALNISPATFYEKYRS